MGTSIKSKLARIFTWEGGQRLFNFAYSVGAAIVIWGALFKILHLPGGNTLLCIGMGTEVLMFILTAFDRPPKEYKWEKVFKQFADKPLPSSGDQEEEEDYEQYLPDQESEQDDHQRYQPQGGQGVVVVGSGQPAVAEGQVAQQPVVVQTVAPAPGFAVSEEDTQAFTDSIHRLSEAADQLGKMAELTGATQSYLTRIAETANQMEQLRETTRALTEVTNLLLNSYRSITDNSEDINANSRGYVDQMSSLNRNIGGLNTIYEIQLKSVSSQLESIDRVNRGIKDIRDMYEKSAAQSARYCEETEKMSRLMQQLNMVYERMVSAMTVNLHGSLNNIPGNREGGM